MDNLFNSLFKFKYIMNSNIKDCFLMCLTLCTDVTLCTDYVLICHYFGYIFNSEDLFVNSPLLVLYISFNLVTRIWL